MTEDELRIAGEGAEISCNTGADNCRQCIHVKYNIPALIAEIRRLQEICRTWENLSPLWREENE